MYDGGHLNWITHDIFTSIWSVIHGILKKGAVDTRILCRAKSFLRDSDWFRLSIVVSYVSRNPCYYLPVFGEICTWQLPFKTGRWAAHQGKSNLVSHPRTQINLGTRRQSFVRQDAFQRALERLRLNCCIWTLWSPSQPCNRPADLGSPSETTFSLGSDDHDEVNTFLCPHISNKPPEIRWFLLPLPSSFSALFSQPSNQACNWTWLFGFKSAYFINFPVILRALKSPYKKLQMKLGFFLWIPNRDCKLEFPWKNEIN